MHLYTPRLSQVKKQPSTSRIHAWQLHIPPQDQSAWDSSYIITINWSRLSSLSIGIQCIPSFFLHVTMEMPRIWWKEQKKGRRGLGSHICVLPLWYRKGWSFDRIINWEKKMEKVLHCSSSTSCDLENTQETAHALLFPSQGVRHYIFIITLEERTITGSNHFLSSSPHIDTWPLHSS